MTQEKQKGYRHINTHQDIKTFTSVFICVGGFYHSRKLLRWASKKETRKEKGTRERKKPQNGIKFKHGLHTIVNLYRHRDSIGDELYDSGFWKTNVRGIEMSFG